jgi:hypothetical protein
MAAPDEQVESRHEGQAQPNLRILPGGRGELEMNTRLVRRFLGIGVEEAIELTAFVRGRPWVYQCNSERAHVEGLRAAESIRDFCGSYMLVNGPISAEVFARYEQNKWHSGWNGRANDSHVQQLRAIFLDVDPIRAKGISSTHEQLQEAWNVSTAVEEWLAEQLGDRSALGHGCSGNGYFTLIAIEPTVPASETTARISKLLALLNRKFGTEQVKIDSSVANPARLMPAPGTWKRKGRNTPERPHRMTSFSCSANVRRVRLEALA